MYEGSFNNPRSMKNGIMSFAGTNGAVVWDFQQKSLPSEINCTILDVNGDGYNDCLVVDESGLKAIESTIGEVLWHAHTSEQTSIPELDMPIKINDFDKDGVGDLLAVYRKETSLVISGKNGLAIANIRLPSGCSYISNLSSSKNRAYIQYNCGRYQNSEIVYEISMVDLRAKFEGSQKQIPFETVDDKDNKVFYVTGDRKLLVENLNHCPHCEGVISLYNTNNTKLYTQSFKNAVIMTPVPFSVTSSKENIVNLKGHLHGFILKIWLWQDNSKKLSPSTRVYKRSIPVHNETFHLNQVSERVVLITLRENDTQVENVSDSDIYLICNGPEHDNCQPDHKNQQYSLMIADLDQDSSLELVSYSSTYEQREEEGYEAWHLISKLKVFRLESELPKLYDKN
nr:uncharacterized protein LOC111504154 isoform X2 [Leptinotarsa decemlineata]